MGGDTGEVFVKGSMWCDVMWFVLRIVGIEGIFGFRRIERNVASEASSDKVSGMKLLYRNVLKTTSQFLIGSHAAHNHDTLFGAFFFRKNILKIYIYSIQAKT